MQVGESEYHLYHILLLPLFLNTSKVKGEKTLSFYDPSLF